jgi:2-amino-4-hydroxy-6-hydroxymethyldihydropteridine diphosphokinase
VNPVLRPKPQRLEPAVRAVLAFGSNLGDREATIRAAFAELDTVPGIHVEAVSPLVETAAVKLDGVDESAPRYLNAAAIITTSLNPHDLLDATARIENAHGRVREERWGDRTLDIDIIDFGGRQLSDERLVLPHPRAAERAFVLAPWLAIDPGAALIGHGTVAELLAGLPDEVVPYAGPVAAADDPDEASER